MGEYITLLGDEGLKLSKVLYIGQRVNLLKDYGNAYDDRAIRVEIEAKQVVGYVANTMETIALGTKSASRVYDVFEDETKGIVRFIVKNIAIIELESSLKDSGLGGLYLNRDKSGRISIIETPVQNKDKMD